MILMDRFLEFILKLRIMIDLVGFALLIPPVIATIVIVMIDKARNKK